MLIHSLQGMVRLKLDADLDLQLMCSILSVSVVVEHSANIQCKWFNVYFSLNHKVVNVLV